MPQNKFSRTLNLFTNVSDTEASFLTVFFYLPKTKRENVEILIQFLQKYHMNFGGIKNKTS
jgi:hypothetical protein